MPEYAWHHTLWMQLKNAILEQRLPQTWLFHGPAGIGKQDLAMRFAQALLCDKIDEQGACGHCKNCLLIQTSEHPDKLLLKLDARTIGVADIRAWQKKFYHSAVCSERKIGILVDVHKLTPSASHALLKTLEEPPEDVIICLLTHDIGSLLPTILSRCCKVQVPAPTTPMALDWLKAQGITENAMGLLKMSGGAPLSALAFSQQTEQKEFFKDWCQLALGQQAPLTLAQKWHEYEPDQCLAMIYAVVTDLVFLHHHLQENLIYPTETKTLAHLAERAPLILLLGFFDTLNGHLRQRRHHVSLNHRLALETICIQWSQCFH